LTGQLSALYPGETRDWAAGVPVARGRGAEKDLCRAYALRYRKVVPLEHPATGSVPGAAVPGTPIKFTNHPNEFDALAPQPGAHNTEIYCG